MLSRAASEFCKLSGLLCSYGLYQVVLSEQLCLYCRGNTSEFSARLVLVDQETGASEFVHRYYYNLWFVHVCTVVSPASAHSRVSAHVCTSFQGVNVAASIQTYGSYIPGKPSAHVGQNHDLCLRRLPGPGVCNLYDIEYKIYSYRGVVKCIL